MRVLGELSACLTQKNKDKRRKKELMEKIQNDVKNSTVAEHKTTRTKKVSIPEDTLIRIRSGFYGKIYYKNPITREKIVFENQGDEQVVTLRELRAMRTSQPAFFKNQWIIIVGVADGEDCSASSYDILKSLAAGEYYKNFIDPVRFDEVCDWSESEIAEKIAMLSPGAKENLIVALNGFIKSGRLDSIKKIKAFEKALNCELGYFN